MIASRVAFRCLDTLRSAFPSLNMPMGLTARPDLHLSGLTVLLVRDALQEGIYRNDTLACLAL